MKKSPLFFLLSALILVGLLQSCKEEKATIPAKDLVVESLLEDETVDSTFLYADGIFKENCISCHQATIGKFINRDWKNGNAWNLVHNSIKSGHASIKEATYAQTLPDSAYEKLTDYILVSIEKATAESLEEEIDLSGLIESEQLNFTLDTVVRGLEIPWGIAFLPDGEILVTDRNGKFYRQKEGQEKVEIKGVPEVRTKGQAGLLDIEVHPDFANNQTIYLAFSKPRGEKEATTAVLKAKLDGDKLMDVTEIFEALPYSDKPYHYGSRLEFDKDGFLYITVGDRGTREKNPQTLENNHCGKIHRLNADGSIPADNPFVNTPEATASIWSYGHRNPQGLVFDKAKGIMWETEHAPRGGDEVNIVKKGLNYGWPIVSYGINYQGTRFTDLTEKEGMEQPVFYYLPSTGTCGLTLVTGDKYPNWKGDLLAGSLRYQYLSRLKMDGQKVVGEERLVENVGRLRAVEMGNDGHIYFSVESPGLVLRIKPVQEAL